MIREGYPVKDLTARENQRLWVTLTQHRRWEQLLALTGMSDAQLQARLVQIRRQVKALSEQH